MTVSLLIPFPFGLISWGWLEARDSDGSPGETIPSQYADSQRLYNLHRGVTCMKYIYNISCPSAYASRMSWSAASMSTRVVVVIRLDVELVRRITIHPQDGGSTAYHDRQSARVRRSPVVNYSHARTDGCIISSSASLIQRLRPPHSILSSSSHPLHPL